MKLSTKIRRWPSHTVTGTCLTLAAIGSIIGFIGYKHQFAWVQQVRADSLEQELHISDQRALKIISEDQALRDKLAQSYIHAPTPAVAALSRFYIEKYFGSEAPIAEKIFTCESGLNPEIVSNPNTNGTKDYGVAQINNVHKAQFEAKYGVSFESGTMDPSMNIQFAKWLYDQSGWGPWSCYKIVNFI